MILETERLILRPWQPRDRSAFATINADPEVRKYYYPSVLDAGETEALIDEAAARLAQDGFGSLAVRRKADDVLIGGAGLSRPGPEVPGGYGIEIGWILGRPYWRQGFATEASLACLRFAWDELAVPDVIGYTSKINLPSQRAMEKIGMAHVGDADFDDVTVPEGNPLRPHVLYRIANPVRS